MGENRTFSDLGTPSPAVGRTEAPGRTEANEHGGPTQAKNPALLATIGRTVLPRVEREGDAIRLVHEQRERYEAVSQLGQGGMGEVRRVRDHDIGRDVAVKRLHTNLNTDGGLSRFVSEVRTVGALEHPNIVPIHDVGVDADGSYFFVMKYVDGLTVEQILKGLRERDPVIVARFPPEARLAIVKGVLQALSYAHAKGVVHRDVKPANVMVGPYGEVMLMDWGIAKTVATNDALMSTGTYDGLPSATATRMGTMVGTPAYMSPEQFRGELDRIDGRSDVYAVGVMTWELLSLKNPAAGLPDVEAVKKLVLERESIWNRKEAPPFAADLAWLCLRATRRDPADRFASAREMLEEIDRIEHGLCRADCEVTALKRATGELGRVVDHHPVVALASVIGAGLAVVATAVLIVVLALT